jgi:hypothetical protein
MVMSKLHIYLFLYKNNNIELIHCTEFTVSALIIIAYFYMLPVAFIIAQSKACVLFLCEVLSVRCVDLRICYGAFLLCSSQLFFCYNAISVHSCRALASRSFWFSQTKLLMNLTGL